MVFLHEPTQIFSRHRPIRENLKFVEVGYPGSTIPSGYVKIATRPGFFTQKTMERSSIFDGKTHYFDWAMASIAMLNCQRAIEHGDL